MAQVKSCALGAADARRGGRVPFTRSMLARWTTIAAVAASLSACTSSPPPAPSVTPAVSDPGPPPAIPTTDGATLTLTAAGISPKQVRVYEGSRVTFVNNDARVHDMRSDPLHLQTDCPELNAIGTLVTGESRASDPLEHLRVCGFHDHVNDGDARFYGVVFVDPR